MCGIPGRRYSTSCMMYVHRTVATWYCTRHIRVHVCVPRTCTTSRYTTFLVMVKWTATKKKWKPEWFYFFITLHMWYMLNVAVNCQQQDNCCFLKKLGTQFKKAYIYTTILLLSPPLLNYTRSYVTTSSAAVFSATSIDSGIARWFSKYT